MNQNKPLQINVEQVLRSKTSKKVPRFLIKLLERIIHQKEMNQFLLEHHGEEGIQFFRSTLSYFNIKLNVIGQENLPDQGRYIFASNHPLGGLDGVSLVVLLADKYNDKVKTLSNDLLAHLKPVADIFVPVNVVNRTQNKETFMKLDEVLNSNNQLLTFPAGACSRKINGKIYDLPWKKTFVTKAKQYNRDIVPIYFEGRNSYRFYLVAKIRALLKIKINFEMMLLVDEMYRHKNKTFTAVIGKPIPHEKLMEERNDYTLSEKIKKHIYSLKPKQK